MNSFPPFAISQVNLAERRERTTFGIWWENLVSQPAEKDSNEGEDSTEIHLFCRVLGFPCDNEMENSPTIELNVANPRRSFPSLVPASQDLGHSRNIGGLTKFTI